MSEILGIKKITVTPMCENCYVLHGGKEAVVFDPGGDYPVIKKFLDENALSVKYILATHGHFDHTGAAAEMKAGCGARFMIHGADERLLDEGAAHSAMYGMGPYIRPGADRLLSDGDVIEFLGLGIKVIHTPGHTAGGVSFYIEPLGALISGDTLFFESVGRTDFETGDPEALIASIKEKLYILPDDTRVFPGHGVSTSIGHEKTSNPFVRG